MANWIESLDIKTYVQALMAKESDAIDTATNKKVQQITTIQTGIKTKITAFGQLQSYFDTFQKKVTNLQSAFNATYQANSSTSTVATIGTESTVTAGVHSLVVTQVAQAQSVASRTFSTNDSIEMTNTVTIGVGSNQFNINVVSGDSLQTIADKINNAATYSTVGVSASVVSTASGSYRLIVSSTNTGVDNAAVISETGTGSNSLNIATGSGDTTVLTSAKNAEFTLDDLSYSLSSNSTAIAGMKINILNIGSSTLSVIGSNDTTKAKTAIQDTVNAYNDMMTYLAKIQATVNAFDPTFMQIQEQFKSLMMNSLPLSDLGIVPVPYEEVQSIAITRADGTPGVAIPVGLLKIDKNAVTGTTLDTFLSTNFDNVKSKLLASDGAITQANNLLTPYTGQVWLTINGKDDKQQSYKGALTLLREQDTRLQKDIDSTKSTATVKKDNLYVKYDTLINLLTKIQLQSQYLSQQISSNG